MHYTHDKILVIDFPGVFVVKDLFKSMVLVLLFIELIWFFIPLDWAFFGNDVATIWNGSGGILNDRIYYYWSVSYSIISFIVYCALYNFIKWSPKALLILILVDLVVTPFFGVAVFSGFGSLLFKVVMTCTGIVLAMAYFSDLKKDFVRQVGGA